MPRLLDLFCGAGGAAMGYHRAGFDVIGVDLSPQPHYPFEFHQADAMTFLLDGFDVIHASPPCQRYSSLGKQWGREYPDLYVPTRERLQASGLPWVIENVIGAPYESGIKLCGSMFGLRVRRHRNFESNFWMPQLPCDHVTQGTPLGVYGHGGGGKMTRGWKAKPSQFAELMGMPWATPREITQAIPPAYTEWVGRHIPIGHTHAGD